MIYGNDSKPDLEKEQEECVACSKFVLRLNYCHFDCGHGFCDKCWQERTKECPECGRTGCREHFDGVYCIECVKVEVQK